MGEKVTRKSCIQNNTPCPGNFVIADNTKANGNPPKYELATFSQVEANSATIDTIALARGVDPRLVKAIMYMETTHGYYDAPLDFFGQNKSIRPMNINVEFWGSTFGTRDDMNDTKKNITAGVEMIARIQENVPGASIEKVATLYNNINATVVTNYGARVKKIYDEQPWVKKK